MIALLALGALLLAGEVQQPRMPVQKVEADKQEAAMEVQIESEGEVPVNGVRLHVRVEGPTSGNSSPVPLVVVHGGPGLDHTYFLPWLDALAHEFKVVYFDQRGCGRSERLADTTAYAMDRTVDDLDALRDSLGVPAISVLGFSYGGFVALKYALAHPDHVHKLILSDTAPSLAFAAEADSLQKARTTPELKAAFDRLAKCTDLTPDERLREEFRLELPLNFHTPRKQGFIDQIADRIRYGAVAGKYLGDHDLPTFDVRGRLSQIHAPTLVMVGDDDIVTPPSQAHIMYDGIRDGGNNPNVTLRLISGAGHLSMIDNRDSFNTNILEFLREPAGQR